MPASQAIKGGRTDPARWLRSLEPTMLVWLPLVGILVFLVLSPMLRLVVSSFQRTGDGGFTFANYAIAYGEPRRLRALVNSLWLGGAVTLLSAVFAVPIAWAISRADMPGKNLVRALVLGAFITPSYLGAIGWILLAGPNAGWLNRVWMAVTGSGNGILNIYSFPGLVFVIAIYEFPYIFVFVNEGLDLVSSEMEDAANILGAGALRTTFRITLPLVAPAILGGAIITFLDTIALFGTPAVIAVPAQFNVMTLQLWQFFEFPVRAEAAAAYSIPLVGITCFLFWVQRLILGRKSFATVGGKAGGRRITRMGRFRWVFLSFSLLVCSLAVFLPYAALGQAAFSKAWGRGFSLQNLTLGNFHYLFFEHYGARQTIIHSFTYAGVTAFLATGLALGIAYIVSRRIVPMGHLLSLLCMSPFVIPGIVLAIGFYAAYAPPPFSLSGTASIMILAFTTRFLPIAYVNSVAGLRAINPEMEEAVRSIGGSRLTAIRRVLAPLLKKSLAGAWILVFIPAIRELSTAIFLVGAKTRVISVMLLDLSEDGNFETLSALGLVLLVATIGIVIAGYRLVGRDFMLRKA
jgi:iron(III) transport system permease protein